MDTELSDIKLKIPLSLSLLRDKTGANTPKKPERPGSNPGAGTPESPTTVPGGTTGTGTLTGGEVTG